MPEITWETLPPRPWPENTEPLPGELADYLTSLEREQLVWLLGQQRETWRKDSDCFMRAHDRQIEDYRAQLDAVRSDLVAIMAALGIGDHARPHSAHDVVIREVIPAIEALRASRV